MCWAGRRWAPLLSYSPPSSAESPPSSLPQVSPRVRLTPAPYCYMYIEFSRVREFSQIVNMETLASCCASTCRCRCCNWHDCLPRTPGRLLNLLDKKKTHLRRLVRGAPPPTRPPACPPARSPAEMRNEFKGDFATSQAPHPEAGPSRTHSIMVLDEADRMLGMGFEQPLRKIMAHIPAPPATADGASCLARASCCQPPTRSRVRKQGWRQPRPPLPFPQTQKVFSKNLLLPEHIRTCAGEGV